MAKVTYHIVEHNGGWAYRNADVFSETFETYDAAREAAERAAAEQEVAGNDEEIEYQDSKGVWRREHSEGDNRPRTDVDETGEGGP